MSLLELKTNFKSLKFGNDRPGGGDSRQPFIKSNIPEGRSAKSPDFLLRNGFLNPINSAKDTLRISKFFTTTEGILFIAKQQALILTSPIALGGRKITPTLEQAYNPLQTLAQVTGNSVGFHTERQGLTPDFNNYTSTYDYLQRRVFNDTANRLEVLYNTKIKSYNNSQLIEKKVDNLGLETFAITSDNNRTLFEYIGGPTASARQGAKTVVKRTTFTDQNPTPKTGNPRPLNINYKQFTLKAGASANYINATGTGEEALYFNTFSDDGGLLFTPRIIVSGTLDLDIEAEKAKSIGPYQFDGNDKNKLNLSYLYSSASIGITDNQFGTTITDFLSDEQLGLDGNGNATFKNKVYDPSFPETTDAIKKDKTKVLTQKQIMGALPVGKGSTSLIGVTDFRKTAGENFKDINKPASTDYSSFNRESTYSSGNPGKRSVRRVNYNVGPQSIIGDEPDTSGVDKINIYDSKTRNNDIEQGDIIQFNMRIINNDSLEDEFLYFRAFIDNFSEQYQADWNAYQYVGRGQKFFTYKGFERSFSLGFTVHAQSRSELLPMWKKLNRLAGATAPDYSQGGYMRGSILKLTLGDYITNHPGILKGFSVSNVLDFGFEIARDENGERITDTNDIQQLPFGFKVTGFNFTSISGGGLSSSNYISSKNSSFVGLGLK
tara:strand:- start:1081 stop:3069 length:1989 start_codon:yes stop_codon:yes gene_type:complete